jgi:membrane protein
MESPMAKIDQRSTQETFEEQSAATPNRQPDERGREAAVPRQLPKAGWLDILWRVQEKISKDNVAIVTAGVAFLFILALFPALGATVSIYGMFTNPEQAQQQLASLSTILPQKPQSFIQEQLTAIVNSEKSALGFGAIGGFVLTLISASKGMKALMTAFNIAYDEKETRGFLKYNAIALLLTIGAILFLVLTLFLITTLPTLFQMIGLGKVAQTTLTWARWPILAAVFMVMLGVLYRYAPSRDKPKWQWVSWGAVAATGLWLIGSAAFSVFAKHYGNFNETYGSLGAAVILLLWFWLTAFFIMLGAELNSAMERQTRKDTRDPKSLRRRGTPAAN